MQINKKGRAGKKHRRRPSTGGKNVVWIDETSTKKKTTKQGIEITEMKNMKDEGKKRGEKF